MNGLIVKNSAGESIALDLLDTDPIKLTLQIEDIEDPTSTKSVYSGTFRVPGTQTNLFFFQDAFSVNGATFNAAAKAEAYIMIEGFYYTQGNIRLTGVFDNPKQNQIEFEVLFMGDTSDFASSIGDGMMSEMETQQWSHLYNYANVTASWNEGLLNGDIIYPLIEWGYSYNSTNNPEQATLSHGFANSFTQNKNHGLKIGQFKPAIRVKAIWDQIFKEAGYTYKSDFIDSIWFKKLYHIGEQFARPDVTVDNTSSTWSKLLSAPIGVPLFPDIQWVASDPGQNYKQETIPVFAGFDNSVTGYYLTPSAGDYQFSIALALNGICSAQTQMYVDIVSTTNTVLYSLGSQLIAPGAVALQYTHTGNLTALTAGQKLLLRIRFEGGGWAGTPATLSDINLKTVAAPAFLSISSFLPNNYKKLDFIRSIIDRFKLQVVPSKEFDKEFIITPWKDWIQQGEYLDWTDKLDGSKDFVSKPFFYTQEREIKFVDEEDTDYPNTRFQTDYKLPYGWRLERSGIELIEGTKEVNSIFAPTPLDSIASNNNDVVNFVIPHLAKDTNPDSGEGRREAIQPKPRILFWNGMKNGGHHWHMNEPQAPSAGFETYPLMSNFDQWPVTPTTFDINWSNKAPLWDTAATLTWQTDYTVYSEYWSEWHNMAYDPFSRVAEAYFNLDYSDILGLNFNDKIWIKDAYWMVTKVHEFDLSQGGSTKVSLLKASIFQVDTSYVPVVPPVEACPEWQTAGPWTQGEDWTCDSDVYTWTASRTGLFSRTTCGSGFVTEPVTYSQTYTSTVSQADAELIADTNFTQEGQAFANATGNCTPLAPDTYYATRTGMFTRNNCGPNYTGTTVSFTKLYTSTISQLDADTIADAQFPTDGQTYANANGGCDLIPVITYSAFRTGTFTRNDCGTGYAGSQRTYSNTYTSTVSQADADSIANTQFPIEGQQFANDTGTCDLIVPTTYTAYRSGSFTKNNCPLYQYGTQVNYSATYSSTISQSDAEAIADANFNGDGQAYANTNGDCVDMTQYVATRSGSFTKNNCQSGQLGSTATYTASYTSWSSQANAEAIADANFYNDGQTWINANGSCTIVTYSAYRSGTFTKNNCGLNEVGSSVLYQRTYTSTISQADADNIANTNFTVDGQAHVNEVGYCTYTPPPTYTAYRTGSFTKNNCPLYETGETLSYSNSYVSNYSQSDAEAIADANFNGDGQAYANANGICTYNPPVTYTAYRSGSFTRNTCGEGYTGTTVTYSNSYTSTVSQADAEAIADANFTTQGQAYANGAGTCTPNYVPPAVCKTYWIANPSPDYNYYSYTACDGTFMDNVYLQEYGAEQICAQQGTVWGGGYITIEETGTC